LDIIDVINNKLYIKKPKSDFSDEEITQNAIYLPLPKEVLAPRYNPKDAPMFWDSREHSLEDQALATIRAMEEMRGTAIAEEVILDTVINRLKKISTYQTLFKKAFSANSEITAVLIGKSIATFERTLSSSNSRFDQFLTVDQSALSMGEKEGFELFKKAGCINCHNGPMFSDYKMHVLSVADNAKLKKI
jgi:cytochrome c peroxidase